MRRGGALAGLAAGLWALVVGAAALLAQPAPLEPDVDQPVLDPTGVPIDATPSSPVPPVDAPDVADLATPLGPTIVIERIDIVGNDATSAHVILQALPFALGDTLAAGDPRIAKARYKLLALGFFRAVKLSMQRGSQRGRIVIRIAVVERGTVMLNRLWFGSSTLTPWWGGADLTERNLLGTGLSLGGGFVYGAGGNAEGSRNQWSSELRLGIPGIQGSRLGAFAAFDWVHGSEPFRIAGTDESDVDAFHAFSYRRIAGRGGLSYDVSSMIRVFAAARAEVIDATPPAMPTRIAPDGDVVAVDLAIQRGRSRVITTQLGLDRDTRTNPGLPHRGERLVLSAELGSSLYGSSYDFASLLGRYEHWWPLHHNHHAIGVRLAGGVILGDAPRFDRIHIAEVDRMVTPRAAGLLLSESAPVDFLGTRPDKPDYGDLGGSAAIEYSMRLFRGGPNRVYGGDFFVGAGVWALTASDLIERPGDSWDRLPVDLLLDAGVRIDTDIGVFEFTFANVLGRIPR